MSEEEQITAELAVHLPPGLETIFGFYDLEVIGLTLKSNSLTVREHIQRLCALAKSSNEKVSLAALKEIRSVVREVMETNGYIALLKSEQPLPDGTTKQLTTHQIARMDLVIADIARRRNSNDTGVPSPRILEPDDVRAADHRQGEPNQIPQVFPATVDDLNDNGGQRHLEDNEGGAHPSDDGEVPSDSPLH